jgi:RimJ/RimL family protein N-acetyltransferase
MRLSDDHLDACLGAVIAAAADGTVRGARVERRGAELVRDGPSLREGPILVLALVEATTELTTERLVLRRFRADDVDDALAYRDDAQFARFLPHVPQPFTRRDAETFVATNMTEPWDRSPTFAVVFEERVIGTVSFEVDATTRTAMIGYAIGQAWWRRGFATEAARAAMAWAIEEHGLVRVWASTELEHVRSQRVLEKLGMRRERVRVADHLGRNGIPVDEVVYGFG